MTLVQSHNAPTFSIPILGSALYVAKHLKCASKAIAGEHQKQLLVSRGSGRGGMPRTTSG